MLRYTIYHIGFFKNIYFYGRQTTCIGIHGFCHMACRYPDLYYHWGIAGKEIKRTDASFILNEKPGGTP